MGGSKRKQTSYRVHSSKKSKFKGNQHSKKTSNENTPRSASGKKIRPSTNSEDHNEDDFNFIMNFNLLKSAICILRCPHMCQEGVTLNCGSLKYGLCHELKIVCQNGACEWSHSFYSSLTYKKPLKPGIDDLTNSVEKKKQGKNPFDVNTRAIIAFREIGRGHTALERFCGVMNMKPPMTSKNFNANMQSILDSYEGLANDSMKSASDELIPPGENSADVAVGFDGSWQKRGYASNNGVVAAVSVDSGKCVDFQVETKTCKKCTVWEQKKHSHPKQYEEFHVDHDPVCKITHTGSAGSMESVAILKVYQRSLAKNQLRYTTYLGDGDSSSYNTVVAAKPYGEDTEIKKGECIGHVQKRVGSRLRRLKKNHKLILSDGKRLSGQGRLTERVMNTLQNCYGMAIRQNVDNLYAMKKSVAAVLFHYSENVDNEARHRFCLRTVDSWCKFQSDKITGKSTYKENFTIPAAVRDLLMPIFKDLGETSLLEKCLHGKTQNPNEALNQIIWKRCPKDVFVERTTLAVGVCSAVLSFNDGESFLVSLFDKFNMSGGVYLNRYCQERDRKRIKKSENQCLTPVKSRRKQLRGVRKGYIDRNEAVEGPMYGNGEF